MILETWIIKEKETLPCVCRQSGFHLMILLLLPKLAIFRMLCMCESITRGSSVNNSTFFAVKPARALGCTALHWVYHLSSPSQLTSVRKSYDRCSLNCDFPCLLLPSNKTHPTAARDQYASERFHGGTKGGLGCRVYYANAKKAIIRLKRAVVP